MNYALSILRLYIYNIICNVSSLYTDSSLWVMQTEYIINRVVSDSVYITY